MAADARAGGSGLCDRSRIGCLVAVSCNFPFLVHGFTAAGACGSPGGRIQIHHVRVGQNHRRQLDHQLGAALHSPRPLRLRDFAADVGSGGNCHAAIDHHGKQGLEINRIARPGAARRNSIVQARAEYACRWALRFWRCASHQLAGGTAAMREHGGGCGGAWACLGSGSKSDAAGGVAGSGPALGQQREAKCQWQAARCMSLRCGRLIFIDPPFLVLRDASRHEAGCLNQEHRLPR